MKQLTLLQQAANRRSNSFRQTEPDGGLTQGQTKPTSSTSSLFWLILHGLCCLISLVLGFRFSRLIFFLILSPTSTTTTTNQPITTTIHDDSTLSPLTPNKTVTTKASRVVVGRHGILIRPWPHPNPEEVMRAHKILEIVQREQKQQYGVKDPRKVIAVTPTYVRTFQALHLTGVMHFLMNSPYDVVWIVVEAGGVTDETKAIVEKSGLDVVHVGFDHHMPVTWADRQRTEDLMRLQALRLIREQRLDGIVMFADDSNMHSLEMFDEVQRVRWFGALSVGILVHSGDPDEPLHVDESENGSLLPIQGPACNSSDSFVGWHTFDARPYAERGAVYIGDMGTVLPRKIEWAGFVLNSRLLWQDGVDKPEWVNDLDSLGDEGVDSPLALLKDQSVVEPLGSCGRKVLLWWLRVEARADSKFPPGWVIDTPLEITVPAKHTPWPDIPPELPISEKTMAVEQHFVQEHAEKRPPKTRSKKKSSRKKKREPRVTDTQFSSRRQGEK